MQQYFVRSKISHLLSSSVFFTETDSIRTVSDSVPVHPENKHPSFNDSRKKNKRKPGLESPLEEPDGKHPDSDHQIDEYA